MASPPLELQLPVAMPSMTRFKESYPESPYLFYKMVPVDDSQFDQILESANDEISKGDVFVRSAPHSDFHGQSLRSVAEYQAQIAHEQCGDLIDPPFHPHTFFVVTSADAEKDGALVVSLNRDSEGRVESFRMPVEDCTGAFIMDEIGETNWSDIKDQAEEVFPPTQSVAQSPGGEDVSAPTW